MQPQKVLEKKSPMSEKQTIQRLKSDIKKLTDFKTDYYSETSINKVKSEAKV
tara:strand:- start:1757 stop:1912 length:156 start_codon:yes stop_codon:yes gene_type:complete